jgi:GT2 family glycosyltransferase
LAPSVAAVTGSYLPAELEHEAQVLFLRYSHMDRRGLVPHAFHGRRRESRHWPLDAWRMGSGANMAVRAETFRRLGGFRTDLGLGTPARGGEDLFLLWSIIRSGEDVVYLPAAMVSHRHHRDVASLHRVLSGYGTGHAAYLRAARAAGAPWTATSIYALSVLYDRAKRGVHALVVGDRATLSLVAHETRGLLGLGVPS